MSTSLYVCLCVCFPLAAAFDYFPPQQVHQVTRWGAYTEHASQHGPTSHSAPTGRSYSYRSDWTGQQREQRQRPLVTQRRVFSRESHWPSGAGFDSAAPFGPPTYQPTSADYIDPQAPILRQPLYNQRPFEPYISPAPAYWTQHSNREDSGDQLRRRIPISPRVQNIHFSSQANWLQNTDSDQTPSVQSQFSLFGREYSPSRSSLNREISEEVAVNLPKHKSVKLRTTQESYFGKDNVPEQSILAQQRVQPPFTRPQTSFKPVESYDEELIKQIQLLKDNGIFPQAEQDLFLGQHNLQGQINVDIFPSLNELINHHQSKLPEQNNRKSKIHQLTTPPKEVNVTVTLPHLISTTENTNWFDQYNPTASDVLDDTLHNERFIPVQELTIPITTPSPHTKDLSWDKIKNQGELPRDEIISYNNKAGHTYSNGHPSVTFESPDIALNLPTSNLNTAVTLPQFISTTENMNWFEQSNPSASDVLDDPLYNERFIPVQKLTVPVTTPSPYTNDLSWHKIKGQGVLPRDEIISYNNRAEQQYPNEHPSVSFESPDIASNLPKTNTKPYVDALRKEIHGLNNVEGNSEVSIEQQPQPQPQPQPRQWESCVGPGDHSGLCVLAELCDLEGSDHHYSATQKYYCIIRHKQSIGICCVNLKTDSLVEHPLGTVPDEPAADHAGEHADHDHDHDHDHHHYHEHCIYPIADYKVCGRSGKMMSNITAQAMATVSDWPWSAVLVFRSTLIQFCGGTVITRRHVLTAAHCFRIINPNDTLVLLGDYDVRQTNESQSRAFAVERLVSNDDYDPATHESDIALLVLNTTTVYNKYIQPACLPVPGPRYANQTAIITGWGRIQYRGQLSSNLREVPLPVWDQDRCIPRFAQTLFNHSMCAGAFEGGRDSCQGDSGGPLLKQCHHSHRWVVIGVVSWGIRCGERDKPGIYTRVNDFIDWIHENIIDNSTDTSNTTIVNAALPVHHFF